MLALFSALPIIYRLVSIGTIILSIGGAIIYWNVHEREIGRRNEAAAIAAKDRKANDAAEKGTANVDACYSGGGTWDAANGVCQH